MSIKILTKNSIDNTNIDGARQNHFSAGMKSGIVKGSLNEGRFFASASNIIALDTCVLLISGHQVVIDSVQYITFTSKPTTPTRYSMIAEISVNENSEPTFRLFIQPTQTSLIQQNLFNTQNGTGTYQIKIGNFTIDTNGEIQEVNRIVDIISGGGDGASADIEFNASAETISSDLQPEVNVDYNEETKKYDMLLKIPSGTGTKVKVGGVVQDEWDADLKADKTELNKKSEVLIGDSHVDNVNFTSDPQSQIDLNASNISTITNDIDSLEKNKADKSDLDSLNNALSSTLIYDGKTNSSLSTITINNFLINDNEILCYDITSGVISGFEADLCVQVGDNSLANNYNTYGLANPNVDTGYGLNYWKAGFLKPGRFQGHGEIIVNGGDATMLCKGVSASHNDGGFRSFGGSCNLVGTTITQIKFYLTSGNLPVDTYIKVYKKLKAV